MLISICVPTKTCFTKKLVFDDSDIRLINELILKPHADFRLRTLEAWYHYRAL